MKHQQHALYVVVLLSMLGSTACAPVLVGGAAAGGYYVGKDERTVGQMTEDAAITSRVKTRFIGDDLVKAFDINVDTYNAVVTLYGSVSSSRAANRAIELARTTKGVRRVVSKLHVRGD